MLTTTNVQGLPGPGSHAAEGAHDPAVPGLGQAGGGHVHTAPQPDGPGLRGQQEPLPEGILAPRGRGAQERLQTRFVRTF